LAALGYRILPMEKYKPGQGALLIYHNEYGEIESYLAHDLKSTEAKIDDGVEIDLPPELIEFCELIRDLGGRALLIGGSVRDKLINKHRNEKLNSKDYDFEIYGLTLQTTEKIIRQKYGEDAIDVAGRSFEVLKVNLPGTKTTLDISATRRDSKVESEDRRTSIRAEGDPRMNIVEAAKRRDVRMNTVSFDPLTNETYDFYDGVSDIKEGVINVTDSAAFREDALRVLRVMQFISRFGFKATPETYVLCLEMVEEGELDKLSRERIAEEFVKLFTKGINPSEGLRFAREIGFIEKYMPELHAIINIPQETKWHPEGDVWEHTLQVVDAAADIARREGLSEEDTLTLVLSALTHDFGKAEKTQMEEGVIRSKGHEEAGVAPARKFLERIFANPKARLTSDITKKVLPLVAEHLKPKYFWDNEVNQNINQTKAVRNLSYRLETGDRKHYPDGGNTSIYLLALLAEADQRGRNPSGIASKREEVADLETWQNWLLSKADALDIVRKAPVKILTAQMYLDMNPSLPKGAWAGVIQKITYLEQLDGKITNHEEAVSFAIKLHETLLAKVGEDLRHTEPYHDSNWRHIVTMEDPRLFLAS
jgi:tRNA nucleotidyltransferase (CCA-adding enzyme)